MRVATLLLTLSCSSAGIAADTGPAPETLLQGLRGTWSGTFSCPIAESRSPSSHRARRDPLGYNACADQAGTS